MPRDIPVQLLAKLAGLRVQHDQLEVVALGVLLGGQDLPDRRVLRAGR